MKTAVLLAAGDGSRIWPYAAVRPKAMIPIAGKPIVAHQAEMLRELGFRHVIIVGGAMCEQIRHYFQQRGSSPASSSMKIDIVKAGAAEPRGTAFSLLAAAERMEDEPFLVLHGDTLLESGDIERLIARFANEEGGAAALISPLREEQSQDWICCRVHRQEAELAGKRGEHVAIAGIMGHPREGYTHRLCAFALTKPFLDYCAANSGMFTNVQVGMMPPQEGYLEMSLVDWMRNRGHLPAVETQGQYFDIDKPWHILQANDWLVKRTCRALTSHRLADGASIHDSAAVSGFVQLGENSRIGRNVTINGNLIAGSNTIIENGAILHGDHMIGDHTYIGNYCCLASGTTVGSHCVVNHCAELDGLIMDTVYLYHYMEFYGIIGTCTDLGAATVCGTLRFDDGHTMHRVNGRREYPRQHANAVYLGDYARTGVNAILMPGVKVGAYSVVGPGVLLQEDVPDRTIVSLKQELASSAWGPERYGW